MTNAAPAARPGQEGARPFPSARLLTTLAVVAILALGLYLRWDRLDYVEFSYDQAWSLNRAYEFVALGDFPVHGAVASIGLQQGPMEIYLLAIPAALSKDPRVATGFVGLLQMLAVLGTYFLASRYFGRTTGLIAAALYSFNPWAVQFGRKLWPDDMMPLLALLFFAALYAAVVQRRRYCLGLACALLAALILTHPSGIMYGPLLLLVVVVFWRRLGWRPLALGAVLGLVVASPYLYDDYQYGFANLIGYASVPGGGEVSIDLAGLNLLATLASDKGLRELLPQAYGDNYVVPALGPLDGLATGLLCLGVAVALWRLWSRRPRSGGRAVGGWEEYLLLLLWFATPVLVTLRHSMTFVHSYFIVVWPLQFILIGLALSAGLELASRVLAGRLAKPRLLVAAGVVAVVLALGASQTSYVLTSLENRARPGSGTPWGVPLVYAERAVATLRELPVQLGPAPLYAYASLNQWPGLHYLARPDLPLQRVEPPQQLVLPRDLSAGAILLVAANDAATQPLGFAALEDTSPVVRAAHDLGFIDLPERTVREPGGRTYFRFLHLPPALGASVLPSFRRPEQQLVLENGLSLAGYRYPAATQPGDSVTLTLLWEMPADPPGHPWRDYVVFAHATDRAGVARAQKDWEMYQYRLLQRAGEYMVSTYELQWPADLGPGLVWLEMGAYERYSREQVRWQDAGGKQLDSAYKVGPIKIAPPANAPAPQAKADFLFGEALALVGYDLSPAQATVGGKVDITLHWQARANPDGDYAVSVQVLDEAGQLVAQHDSPPVGGNYPTSYWAAGETVLDQHPVALPKDAKPGAYLVVVVVYSQQTQQRLRVDGADSASLATLPVK